MGILMRNTNGKLAQLANGLSFKEAFSMVCDLRSKRDGNYYWIGSLD